VKIISHQNFKKMKKSLLGTIIVLTLLLIQNLGFSQAPTLGTAANFVLFSSVGAVTNTGITHLTGNVGTNSGSSTGFGNVNGVMHDGDRTSAQCGADLLIAYYQLNSAIPNYFPAALQGNGQIVTSGIYSIFSVATLNLDLTLDAQGNPNAVFIFQINGAFATNANAEVKLLNGAKACNVFWKIEGLVNMATGTIMKGTVIANNAAIVMNTGVLLEGRALSTSGAISVDGVTSYTPIGCGSAILNGPVAPVLKSTECYAIFSSNGAVSNAGISTVTGDIGTNVGLTTGYNALNVNGTIHPIPDVSTAQSAADLIGVYNYLNVLPFDIELLYPAQFGSDLVLTPHTYLLNAATVLTNTVYLNADGNANAVFVIKINGALSTSTFAKVVLINGTQAKNVYWKIDGAVLINDNSIFKGTIVANNGAVNLTTGVVVDGRVFTTNGALSTAQVTVKMPVGCSTFGTNTFIESKKVLIYPNPFQSEFTVYINSTFDKSDTHIILYDNLGKQVKKAAITERTTTLDLNKLTSGVYFYEIISTNKIIQSGKLLAK
jgi:Ice-binding-like/Secretion system C-terminal sorting domain